MNVTTWVLKWTGPSGANPSRNPSFVQGKCRTMGVYTDTGMSKYNCQNLETFYCSPRKHGDLVKSRKDHKVSWAEYKIVLDKQFMTNMIMRCIFKIIFNVFLSCGKSA